MKSNLLARAFCVLLFSCALIPARAQWVTNTVRLTNGWNSVYLHVDATHLNLNSITPDPTNPILEIWKWEPLPGTAQFFTAPQDPSVSSTPWRKWIRTNTPSSTLATLTGNSAYLVRVRQGAPLYDWRLVGKPLLPEYRWTGTGENFIGLPIAPGANTGPFLNAFFAPVNDFLNDLEIFHYPGGEIGSPDPKQVFKMVFNSKRLRRGEALWMRNTNVFNHYFGPFQITLASGASGIDFRDDLGHATVRFRNFHTSEINLLVKLIASENDPAGQRVLNGITPLLVRGALKNDLTYEATPLTTSAPHVINLKPFNTPGSEKEVVIGLNRAALSNSFEGDFLAGVLRFTDSLGQLSVDLPVSAVVSSTAGLWAGEAKVTQVGSFLREYARATNNAHMQRILDAIPAGNLPTGAAFVRDTNSNLIMVRTTNGGRYLALSTNTTLTNVTRPAQLRLIVHNDANPSKGANLMQQAFFGLNANSNYVVAAKQSALSQTTLASARRISSAHLPWTPNNTSWKLNGTFASGQNLTSVVIRVLASDQASNPFLHTYHPDHDNRDAAFKPSLDTGVESYDIQRVIALQMKAAPNDFASLTSAATTLQGEYFETITLIGLAGGPGRPAESREFVTKGVFALNRLSNIPTLTQ